MALTPKIKQANILPRKQDSFSNVYKQMPASAYSGNAVSLS